MFTTILLTMVCKCLGTEETSCWSSLSYIVLYNVQNVYS